VLVTVLTQRIDRTPKPQTKSRPKSEPQTPNQIRNQIPNPTPNREPQTKPPNPQLSFANATIMQFRLGFGESFCTRQVNIPNSIPPTPLPQPPAQHLKPHLNLPQTSTKIRHPQIHLHMQPSNRFDVVQGTEILQARCSRLGTLLWIPFKAFCVLQVLQLYGIICRIQQWKRQ
jgi:hypothetical protein